MAIIKPILPHLLGPQPASGPGRGRHQRQISRPHSVPMEKPTKPNVLFQKIPFQLLPHRQRLVQIVYEKVIKSDPHHQRIKN